MATRLGNLLRLGVPLGARYIDYVQSLGLTSIYRYNETATESPLVLRNWANTGTYPGPELLTNGDFSAWTGDDPDGWGLVEVGDATSNITQNPTGECQIISTGPITSISQVVLTIGKRYCVEIQVSASVIGALQLLLPFPDAPLIDTVGTYRYEGVAVNSSFTINRGFGNDDITISNASVREADSLNGDNNGATIGQNGQLGSNEAYLFDGNDDYIQIANNAALADLTTQRWMFLCQPTSLGESEQGVCFMWGLSNEHYLRVRSLNRLEAKIDAGAGTDSLVLTNTDQVDFLNQWAIIFMDYDDSNELGNGRKIRLFKGQNETLTPLTLETDTALIGSVTIPATDLFLGNSSTGSSTFDGLIDETLVGAGLWTTQEMQNLIRLTGV
jgi:hypothetical protein